MAALLVLVTATAARGSTITWASHPVLPNETLLLQVSPFPNGSRVLLRPADDAAAAPIAVSPEYATDAGVAVVVPASFPSIGVFTAAVEGSSAPPFRVNSPDLMWVQGSEGEATAPGGWIRAFGRSLAFVPVGQVGLSAPPVGWMTTLRLTPAPGGALSQLSGTSPTVIAAAFHNVSSFQAFFRVPERIAPGEYQVALSNGPSGYVELDCFTHPTQPHVRTIVVRARSPRPAVHTWDPRWVHGVNESNGQKLIDSSAQLQLALTQAGAAGSPGSPKVLQLERGWYAVAGALKVPHGVTIKGAGEGKTLLIWQYQDVKTSVPALLSAADETTPGQRWGLEDLSITANTYFHAVVNISANTNGFKMRRVNIRANSFFCASRTGVENVTKSHEVAWSENSAQGAASESHIMPFAMQVNGRNWEVSDCDIYSSWGVFTQPHTALLDPKEMGGYGYLARNRLFNGKGPTVDCDGAKQWIVEDNVVTGVSPMSGGNSIATGEAAFMHHLYWGRNSFQFDWGQDREIMTFDGGGIGYGGAMASVDTTGTVIKSARLCHPTHIFTGGSLLILNGTGAGQMRRLISWEAAEDGSGCFFTIDRKFETTLEPASGQWISAQIFKGASLWEGNHYLDTGSFQL